MSRLLATLPCVEPDTIKTDANKLQVRFAVKDRTAFNLDEVKRTLTGRYSSGVQVLVGPTSQ